MQDARSWIRPDGSGQCPHCGYDTQYDGVPVNRELSAFLSGHSAILAVGQCTRCKKVVVEWITTRLVTAPGRFIATGVEETGRQGIYPTYRKAAFSEHVPAEVATDLTEAFAVASISARGAAMLARRALQNALRHAGFKHPTSRDLKDEIELAINDPRTPSTLNELLDAVRTAGNDSAHPNRDYAGDLIEVPNALVLLLLDTVEELCDVYFVKPKSRRPVLDAWKDRRGVKPE
jgi:hypothetical protein